MASDTARLLERAQERIQEVESKFNRAMEVVRKQREILENIAGASFTYATVIGFDQRKFVIGLEDNGKTDMKETNKPVRSIKVMQGAQLLELGDNPKLKIEKGNVVKIMNGPTGPSIIEVSSNPISVGQTGMVLTIIDEDRAEVEFGGNKKVAYTAGHASLEKGHRVILDETGSLIVHNMGKDTTEFVFNNETNTTWDSIGGQEKAKSEIKEAIEGPILNAEIYKAYGKKVTKGILLWGPPGNGKTMFGKAIATSVAQTYGTQESGFIYVKGPEILNMYVGASEERIRRLFSSARDFKKRTGCPAVLFIDEAEAILSQRGSGRSSDMDKTIVPQFLSEMDGLDDSGAIVVLTTNRPDMLDSAIIREGRIDKKIRIERPDYIGIYTILKINLESVLLSKEHTADELAELAAQAMLDPSLKIFEIHSKKRIIDFKYSNIISGAMVAAIVNDAVGLAIKKDLESKTKKPSGLGIELLSQAIRNSYNQNKRMNHEVAIDDLKYELSLEDDHIVDIKQAKHVGTEEAELAAAN